MTLRFEEINKTHTKTINGAKIVFKPSNTPPEKWENYYQHFPELFETPKPIRYEATEQKRNVKIIESREAEREMVSQDLEIVNENLETQLTLAELRAKYPHIKSNSVKGFLKKLEDAN